MEFLIIITIVIITIISLFVLFRIVSKSQSSETQHEGTSIEDQSKRNRQLVNEEILAKANLTHQRTSADQPIYKGTKEELSGWECDTAITSHEIDAGESRTFSAVSTECRRFENNASFRYRLCLGDLFCKFFYQGVYLTLGTSYLIALSQLTHCPPSNFYSKHYIYS